MSNSRTKNSILIMSSGIFQKLINILVGFLSRKIFIVFLGMEYLGINGLFTNILSFLSLAELGIGSAITVYLYKPLAQGDENEIGIYMHFYRKCYFIIGCIVLTIGMGLIPFLPTMVNFDQAIDVNLYLVYILFLSNSVCSYWFFAYKSSLIDADQKAYITNNITTFYSFLASFLKCVIIILFRKFELALFTELAIGVLKNLVIAGKADKLYPVLRKSPTGTIKPEVLRKMFYDVKGLIIQNISVKFFSATDNIIISTVLGTIYVGFCDNYTMIINYIVVIVAMMTASLGAGIGNLNAKESLEKRVAVFRELDFAGFWLSSFCAVCLCQLLTPFIQLVFGSDFIVERSIVLALSLDFFIATSGNILNSFKTSMGLLREGCYIALTGGSLNIALSIILAKWIGLPGVFIATIFSKFFFVFLPNGWYVFKKGFELPAYSYIMKQVFRTGITLAMIFLVQICCGWISPLSWLGFILQGIICIGVPNLVFIVIFGKSEEFQAVLIRGKQLCNQYLKN